MQLLSLLYFSFVLKYPVGAIIKFYLFLHAGKKSLSALAKKTFSADVARGARKLKRGAAAVVAKAKRRSDR